MTDAASQLKSRAEVCSLAGLPRPIPAQEALEYLRQVATQIAALHARQELLRTVSAEAISVDAEGRLHLHLRDTEPLRGTAAHIEYWPPELQGIGPLALPRNLGEARRMLQQHGRDCDPRRIDIYQIGALGLRLFADASVAQYVSSPKVTARIPPAVRGIIDRALGHDIHSRLEDCQQLCDALEQVRMDIPADNVETPPRGSMFGRRSDTPSVPPRENTPSAAHVVRDLPFDQLGQFKILDRIGRGGMGDVYKGYDTSLGRHVALKVLPPELARSEDLVRRFQAEAAAAARLAHPNIVPIYFIGYDSGHHFFAMQFVDGQSLAELLSNDRRLSAEETTSITRQCLEALAAAHVHGLIHRDVKPGNILLDRHSGRAMLADFGLVHSMSEGNRMTATGVIMGTLDYIAPEQARGHRVDGRADLYSLGVLMYRMLSGRLPFVADTPTAMVFQLAYEKPPALKEVAPDVPEPLCTIVERLMAKKPDERYLDCRAVLADIEAFRSGRPLSPSPRGTEIIKVADFDPLPEEPPPLEEARQQPWWREWWDRAESFFWRKAPRFVSDLQSTTQQVGRAVDQYERRRNHLARLAEEADCVAAQFAEQIAGHRQAAADAAERAAAATDADLAEQYRANQAECARIADEFESQLAEQQAQAVEIRQRLDHADDRLRQLQSQRDALEARLKAARARWKMAGGSPVKSSPRRVIFALVLGLAVFVPLILFRLFLPGRPTATAAGKPIPFWIERLQNKEVKTRFEATQALGKMGPDARDAVPALLKTLEDENTAVRMEAMFALGQVGPEAKAAVAALVLAAQDRDPGYRGKAIEALGKIGAEENTVVPVLVEVALNDESAGWPEAAFKALHQFGPKGAVAIPTLRRVLEKTGVKAEYSHNNPRVRAIRILSDIGGPEAVRLMAEGVKDPDQDVRKEVLQAFEKHLAEAATALPVLREALQMPDPKVRATAIEILRNMKPDAVPDLVRAFKKNEDHDTRRLVVQSLTRPEPITKEGIPTLIEALHDGELKGLAVEALCAFGPEAVGPLVQELHGTDRGVRLAAFEVLRRIGQRQASDAVPDLIAMLKEGDENLREGAMQALHDIGPTAAPYLLEAIKDRDNNHAFIVLGRLQEKAAVAKVPALVNLLADKDPLIRERAIRALGIIGQPARDAAPAVREALKDTNSDVRRYAKETLDKIHPGG